MMQMVGAFAEFERAMLPERTKAGLDSARRYGRIGGPVEIIASAAGGDQTDGLQTHNTAADAARLFRIHPATVCRLLARPPPSPVKKAKHAK